MTTRPKHTLDPRGLIREAYRIEGISTADCRSIFLDWAMGLPAETDGASAAAALRAHHDDMADDHPMSRVLAEAAGQATARRRGGPMGRRRKDAE